MPRYRCPRQLAPLLSSALAAACYLGLPEAEAEAAKPQRGGGFDEGAYVMGSPGAFVMPFSERDFTDLAPSFGWGFGGGYMFARGKLFKATVGGVFEHAVVFVDGVDYRDFGVHILRFMPEGRVGLGTDKVWGYGLFGAGVDGILWRADLGWFGSGRDSAPGFNGQFGGGVQGIVWKKLFLGGEVDLDLGLYFDDNRRNRDFTVFSVSVEFLIGWCF